MKILKPFKAPKIKVTMSNRNEIKVIVNSPKKAFDIFIKFYSDLIRKERVFAMYLNNDCSVIGVELISEGALSSSVFDIGLIMQTAILVRASSFLICHNHPSGNRNPSEADLKLTKKVKKAGELLDITLVDHLIIFNEDKFVSLSEEGIL